MKINGTYTWEIFCVSQLADIIDQIRDVVYEYEHHLNKGSIVPDESWEYIKMVREKLGDLKDDKKILDIILEKPMNEDNRELLRELVYLYYIFLSDIYQGSGNNKVKLISFLVLSSLHYVYEGTDYIFHRDGIEENIYTKHCGFLI